MKLSNDTIDRVWERGRVAAGHDPTVWRKDECGAWINYEHHGSEDSEFAWRIVNVAVGGSGGPDKLRPMHRENDFNRNTGRAVCRVRADREGTPPTAQLGTPKNTPA